MKYIVPTIILHCLILLNRNCFSQPQENPEFKLFLVGDAGEGDTTGTTLLALKTQLLKNPKSAVIFLGDNCYVKPYFILPLEIGGYDGSKVAKRRLMSQLNILRDYRGFVYFIPGNHDWWNKIKLKKGMKRLLSEQHFIEDTLKNFEYILNHKEGTFLPSNGSPGPVSVDINEGKTRIIFIDTYRLIIEEGKKKHIDSSLLNTFYAEFKSQLNDASNKKEKIIVVAHHPIHSKGKHSAPLVFIERLYKRFAVSNINYAPYNKMANRLDSLLKENHYPGVYYICGHEHALEYFFNDSLHYLVSGSGSRVDRVKYKPVEKAEEYLIWNEEGFFEIDFYGQKETVLMYHRKINQSKLEVHCVAGCN